MRDSSGSDSHVILCTGSDKGFKEMILDFGAPKLSSLVENQLSQLEHTGSQLIAQLYCKALCGKITPVFRTRSLPVRRVRIQPHQMSHVPP